MSMQSVALPRNLSARAIRDRLMKPPGGRDSSELEIISGNMAKAIRIEQEERRKGLLLDARERRARELLADFSKKLAVWVAEAGISPSEPIIPRLKVSQIVDAASEYFGVPVIHILSARRKASWVWPRRTVMYLAREHTECSFPMIGARLGGRDHTTCITGFEEVASLLREGDKRATNDIAALRGMLEISA